MKVQLLAIDARPSVRAIINDAPGAARLDAPAMSEGVSEGLNFHIEQNKNIGENLKMTSLHGD